MRHFWRKTLLLMAAAALFLTAALAADGTEPTGFRVLNQRETVNVVNTYNPYWPMTMTLNAGTAVWNHVDGAKYYKVGLGIGVDLVDEANVYNNYWDLSEYLGGENTEYFIAYLPMDAEDNPLLEDPQVISWQYTAPAVQLSTPQITASGSVSTITAPLEHVDRYEVEVYETDAQEPCDMFEVEWPNASFSIPDYVYTRYPADVYAVRVRAISDEPLTYRASHWSAQITLDAPVPLSKPTGVRILQKTEEVEVVENGKQLTRTLYPGSVVWDNMEGDVRYIVEYYRVAESQNILTDSWSLDSNYLPVEYMEDVLATLGTYYAQVSAETETPGYRSSEPVRTENWVNSQVPAPLPCPTVTVDGSIATISLESDNVLEYELRLLDRETEEELITYFLNLEDPTYSVSEDDVERYPGHAFSIQARAIAKDPTQNGNSEWSGIVLIDLAERLDPVTGARFVTEPTTIEVDYGDGTTYERELYPGAIVWGPVAGAERYRITIYRNGVEYQNYSTIFSYCSQWWYPWEQLPGGTYTARVWADCNDETMLPSEPAETAPWVYTQPETMLQKPSNLCWEGTKAVIDPVEYAENYYYMLYYSPTENGTFTEYPAHYRSSESTYDFSEQFQELGNGFYYFKVTAYCDDVTTAVASPISDASSILEVNWDKLPVPENFHMAQTTETVQYTDNGELKEVTVYPGFLTWKPVAGAKYYLLHFYPAGETDWIFGYYVHEPYWNAFYEELLESGKSYDITLEAIGVSGETMSSDKAVLQNWTYTVPEDKLPSPTVTQSGYSISIAQSSSASVYGYRVEILRGADRETARMCYMENITGNTFALPDYIQTELDGDENYYIRVLACSNNFLTTADSDWSQLVWLTEPESVKETISKVEQIVMELPETPELEDVQTELQKIETEKLQTALVEKPAETVAQIAALEEKVGADVTVQDKNAQTSDVQVVGLGLSAVDAAKAVTLTVTQEERTLQLLTAPEMDERNFQNAIDVTFEATNVKDELVIPVQISLPVSTDNPDQLRLYKGDNLDEVPIILADGYVRFAVADLSETYVLAEANLLGEVTVNDKTVTVIAQAPTGTTLYAASYDEGGRMRDVATAPVAEGQISYTLSLTPGTSVRVFLLDDNQMPLCQTKVIEKS